MEVIIKPFKELTTNELYKIIQLRIEVFILEQTCFYQDLDGYDDKAYHVQILEDNEIVAYARVFKSGIKYPVASIGRVITSPQFRGKGYGDLLMKEAIKCAESLDEYEIMLSSQSYAQDFYAKHGFKRTNRASYLEDDIPHVEMKYKRGE